MDVLDMIIVKLFADSPLAVYAADITEPVVPAFQSKWPPYHILPSYIAYLAFIVAFCTGVIYLIKKRREEKNGLVGSSPSFERLDRITIRAVIAGLFFLLIGIVTGALWANSAWGCYWSWDPKETWAFVTFLAYTSVVVARYMIGWHGRKLAKASIAAFLFVAFMHWLLFIFFKPIICYF